MDTNVLYYGDNLGILRKYIPDESVDLVYLDPPFNSNRAYSVIFKDESGRNFDAQQMAFDDSWHWGPNAEEMYAYLTNTARHEGRIPSQVSTLIAALHSGIRPSPMLAYLVEMTVRLVELHRALKPTGSLYLHCDPTASAYLKIMLDAIFGAEHFRNEIVWKRAQTVKGNFGQGSRFFGPQTDSILFYTKSQTYTFNQPFTPYSQDYIEGAYRLVEPGTGRRYRLVSMIGPGGAAKGNPKYAVMGVERYWRYSKERMQALIDEGLVVQTSPGTVPSRKYYLDEGKGVPVQSLWNDINSLQASSADRLGYQTQKPLELLERIIQTSSNPGDLVLDPFCGCGTALVAAQKLGRRWIGIDITWLAIAVMKARLLDSFPEIKEIDVPGQPTEVEGVRAMLAAGTLEARYQFQWWALTRVGAKPVGGIEKKGADKGVDGIITFTNAQGELETVLVSVKSGTVNSGMVQQLRGALDTHKAAIGLFVTLEEPSGPMKQEATTAGFYHSELTERDYPRLQILSIRELLEEHKKPDLPLFVMPAFQKATKVQGDQGDQQKLALG